MSVFDQPIEVSFVTKADTTESDRLASSIQDVNQAAESSRQPSAPELGQPEQLTDLAGEVTGLGAGAGAAAPETEALASGIESISAAAPIAAALVAVLAAAFIAWKVTATEMSPEVAKVVEQLNKLGEQTNVEQVIMRITGATRDQAHAMMQAAAVDDEYARSLALAIERGGQQASVFERLAGTGSGLTQVLEGIKRSLQDLETTLGDYGRKGMSGVEVLLLQAMKTSEYTAILLQTGDASKAAAAATAVETNYLNANALSTEADAKAHAELNRVKEQGVARAALIAFDQEQMARVFQLQNIEKSYYAQQGEQVRTHNQQLADSLETHTRSVEDHNRQISRSNRDRTIGDERALRDQLIGDERVQRDFDASIAEMEQSRTEQSVQLAKEKQRALADIDRQTAQIDADLANQQFDIQRNLQNRITDLQNSTSLQMRDAQTMHAAERIKEQSILQDAVADRDAGQQAQSAQRSANQNKIQLEQQKIDLEKSYAERDALDAVQSQKEIARSRSTFEQQRRYEEADRVRRAQDQADDRARQTQDQTEDFTRSETQWDTQQKKTLAEWNYQQNLARVNHLAQVSDITDLSTQQEKYAKAQGELAAMGWSPWLMQAEMYRLKLKAISDMTLTPQVVWSGPGGTGGGGGSSGVGGPSPEDWLREVLNL